MPKLRINIRRFSLQKNQAYFRPNEDFMFAWFSQLRKGDLFDGSKTPTIIVYFFRFVLFVTFFFRSSRKLKRENSPDVGHVPIPIRLLNLYDLKIKNHVNNNSRCEISLRVKNVFTLRWFRLRNNLGKTFGKFSPRPTFALWWNVWIVTQLICWRVKFAYRSCEYWQFDSIYYYV